MGTQNSTPRACQTLQTQGPRQGPPQEGDQEETSMPADHQGDLTRCPGVRRPPAGHEETTTRPPKDHEENSGDHQDTPGDHQRPKPHRAIALRRAPAQAFASEFPLGLQLGAKHETRRTFRNCGSPLAVALGSEEHYEFEFALQLAVNHGNDAWRGRSCAPASKNDI